MPELRRAADGHAFYGGVLRCGSVWECPVCQSGIQSARAEELRRFGELHRRKGGELYLGTFTVPHDYGDQLERLRRHVATAWRSVLAGKSWAPIVARYGVLAYVRAAEVTNGPNGWHPHLHVVLATRRPLSEADETALLAVLRDRWEAAVRRLGWPLPSREHGVTLVRCVRDDYVAKLASELVRSGRKRARGRPGEHRTPFEILEDVADLARPRDVALWQEYAGEMRGARQLTWGGALRNKAARAEYGIEEQTDLELAFKEEQQPAAVVYTFERFDWELVADDHERQAQLLECAERAGSIEDATDAVWRQLELFAGRDPPPF